MKKIYFLPFLSLLVSCGSGVGIQQVDKRATTELALLKEFAIADSTYLAQINDVTKKESFDNSAKKLTDLIENNLKNKFENWEATIKSIDPGIDGIDATYTIFKKADFEDRSDITDLTITFDSKNVSNDQLQKVLKALQPGDVVLISGTFNSGKDGSGILNFQTIDRVSIDNEDQLRYPSFNIILTDIKKKPIEKI